jgi:predicted DNA-binding ribbon-helix-helix protein
LFDNSKEEGEEEEKVSISVKRSPTSMNLEEELWDKVKIRAIELKITATEIVEQALRDWLSKHEQD